MVLAVLAVAWLVLNVRGVELEADGQALADRAQKRPVPAAEIERAREELRSARRFRVDSSPRLIEAALLVVSERRSEAARLARELVELEPDNAEAWLLAYASAPDRRERERAKREVIRLNPWSGELLP